MFTRRHLIATTALLPFSRIATAGDNPEGLIAAIEKRAGGRLGVAALDTQTGRRIAWRAGERFAMCSTFKLLAVAAVLKRVDEGKEQLDRWVPYGKADLGKFYAPVTKAHAADGGMHLQDLAAAAIEWSDNTAANLLLASLGGPAAYTRYARSLGDTVTRLDRIEPDLNTGIPGDPRDTTSPSAMMGDLQLLTLDNALSAPSRARLTGWLADCKTASARIPAGLPKGWRSGNKTGTGDNNTTNDVAIIWPPGRKPILLSVYFTGSKAPAAACEAAIADVARIVSATFV